MWKVNVPAGKRTPYRHFHSRFEISLVTGGSGVYHTDSGAYSLEAGDMMVFASNEYHSISEVGEKGLSFTNLQFEAAYLEGRRLDRLSEDGSGFFFLHSPLFKNRIKSEDGAALRNLFCLLEQEVARGEAERHLAAKAYLNLIICELIRNHGYLDKSGKALRFADTVRAMEYIEEHLSEKLTLQDVSAVAGMTPNYFSALFREQRGVTLWEYITSKRVEQAMELISTDRRMNMLDVALSCGFNNTANFNKAFKRQTGVTPSFFKKHRDYLNQ
jgi:AraC-like DNA-binding protein